MSFPCCLLVSYMPLARSFGSFFAGSTLPEAVRIVLSYAQQSHSTGAGRRTRFECEEWPRIDVANHATRERGRLRIVQLLRRGRDGSLDP